MEPGTCEKKKINPIKIVYFDEDAISDITQINHGGIQKDYTSTVKDKKSNNQIEANTEIGVGGKNIFGFIKAFGGVSGGVEFLTENNEYVKREVTSTLLTEFLELYNKNKIKGVTDLCNKKVVVKENSMTYLKLYSKYLAFINESIETGNGPISISDIASTAISDVLYDSVILEAENESCIARFNSDKFKNNYCLYDMITMNLNFCGIKVGSCKVDDLEVGKQMLLPETKNSMESIEAEIKNDNNEMNNEGNDEVIIYDIVLAYVESDESIRDAS